MTSQEKEKCLSLTTLKTNCKAFVKIFLFYHIEKKTFFFLKIMFPKYLYHKDVLSDVLLKIVYATIPAILDWHITKKKKKPSFANLKIPIS